MKYKIRTRLFSKLIRWPIMRAPHFPLHDNPKIFKLKIADWRVPAATQCLVPAIGDVNSNFADVPLPDECLEVALVRHCRNSELGTDSGSSRNSDLVPGSEPLK